MKKIGFIIIGIIVGFSSVGIAFAQLHVFTVPQGGTGASTLSGCLSGNGTGAITGNGSACGAGGGGTGTGWASSTDTTSIHFTGSGSVTIGVNDNFVSGSSLLANGQIIASSTAVQPPVTNGLVVYTNPESGFTYRSTSNSSITQWNDLSGKRNNLTQTAGQADVNQAPYPYPYLSTAVALNSGLGFQETIANPFKQVLSLPTNLSLDTQSMSVFVVAKPEYNNKQMAVFSASTTCLGCAYNFPALITNMDRNASSPGAVALQIGTTSVDQATVSDYSNASTQLFGFTSGSATTTIYHNYKKFNTTHLSATTTVGGTIGNNKGNDQFAGQIYEVLIFNRALSDTEVDALQSWVAKKYGEYNQTHTRVLAIGDSITEGYGSSHGENVYPNMLAYNKNLEVINMGLSGATASGWESTYIASAAIPKFVTGKKNIALVMIGSNDIGAGSTAAQTIASLRNIGTALRNAGFKTAVMPIIPRSSFTAGQEVIRLSVNQSLITDGNAYYDYLIRLDQNSIFGSSGIAGNTTYYSDGTHLTNAGLQIIRIYAEDAVNALSNISTMGSVSIGTTTPSSLLYVNAVASSTNTSLFSISSSTNSLTTTLFNVSNTGSTTVANGINLTAGCFSLSGTCISTGGSGVTGGTAGMLASWVNSTTLTATGTPTAASYYASSTSATSIFQGGLSIGDGTPPTSKLFVRTDATHPLYVANSDNSSNDLAQFWAQNLTVGIGINYNGIRSAASGGSLFLDGNSTGGVYINSNSTGKIGLGVPTAGSKVGISENLSLGPTFYLLAAPLGGAIFEANVGIGTSSPYAKLSVVGASGVVADKFFATSTTATSTFLGGLSVGTTTTSATNQISIQNSSSGTNILNLYGSTGLSVLNVANSGALTLSNSIGGTTFTPSNSGGQVYVDINKEVLINNSVFLGTTAFSNIYTNVTNTGLTFPRATNTTIKNADLATDVTPGTLSIISGNPFSSASTNKSAGDILIRSGTPLAGGNFGRIILQSNGGNVGIGTTSPYASLSVVGSTGVVAGKYTATSTNDVSTFPYASTTVVTSSGNAMFSTGGTGFVGVRAAAPTFPLQVGVPGSTVSPQDLFNVSSGNYGFFSLNATNASGNSGFAFNQGNALGDSAGNGFMVEGLIGTQTDDYYGLNTTYNSDLTNGSWVFQPYYGAAFHRVLAVPFGTNTASFAGKVGIGTTSPWKTLSVVGTMAVTAPDAFALNDSAVCWRANGIVTVDSGVSSCIVSTRKVKHDIVDLSTSQSTDRIMSLNPVSFSYNGTNKPDLGLIAEDVAEVDSRYAQYNPKNEPSAINWAAVTADLIKTVQNQQKEIESLKELLIKNNIR